jgi:hypothetical protein
MKIVYKFKISKYIYIFVVATLAVVSIEAKIKHTNNTFISPRSLNSNLAIKHTTWHKQTDYIDEEKGGACIQLTGFCQDSINNKDLGKYLGIYNDKIEKIQDFISVSQRNIEQYSGWDGSSLNLEDNPDYSQIDALNPLDIFHVSGSNYITAATRANLPLEQKLTLRPKCYYRGVCIDFQQKFDHVLLGPYFRMRIPIAQVKTSLAYTGTLCIKQKLAVGNLTSDNPADVLTGEEKSFDDYLTGSVDNYDPNNKQSSLEKAKFHKGKEITGVADIEIILGNNFLYRSYCHLGLNAALTIPTGNVPDGEWLLEPLLGNRGHWGAGFGFDFAYAFGEGTGSSLEFMLAFDYRYLFKDTEKRTIPFKRNNSPLRSRWGHYMLIAEHGKKGLFPAANVTTQNVEVSPKSVFDGTVGIALNSKDFTIDLGYNFYVKERETVRIKSWHDNRYAVPYSEIDVDYANFDINDPSIAYNKIQQSSLLPSFAASPEVMTHKIFGGIGYTSGSLEYPLMVAIGGSFEVSKNNNAYNQWCAWAKVGFSV